MAFCAFTLFCFFVLIAGAQVFFYFCTFVLFVLFMFFTFFVQKWLRVVKIYLHAKFRASSSKIERVMFNLVCIFYFCTFVLFVLFMIFTFFAFFAFLRFCIFVLFCFVFLYFFSFVLLYFVIWLDSPYELPCKIWSL